MFSLRDFFHLPQLDVWVEQLSAGEPGLAVVAGLDSRPGALSPADRPLPSGLLPSGRSAIFSILIGQALTRRPAANCLVIAQDPQAVRVPRQFRKRMRVLSVDPPFSYAGRIEAAIDSPPELLVLDRLNQETVGLALQAAAQGLFVLAPLDTIFYGSEVARHLLDLGAPADRLAALRWVISVQRLSTLCPHCKRPSQPTQAQVSQLRSHPLLHSNLDSLQDLVSALSNPQSLQVFQSTGCSHCHSSGRQGEAAVFDVFYNPAQTAENPDLLSLASVLPVEAYVGRLALLGYLSLEDFLDFNAEQFRRVGHTL